MAKTAGGIRVLNNGRLIKQTTMSEETYRKYSKTPEGRKQVHDIMLHVVRSRMNQLLETAPKANREKISEVFTTAYGQIKKIGNSQLFNFFANEAVSERDFISYIDDIRKGRL